MKENERIWKKLSTDARNFLIIFKDLSSKEWLFKELAICFKEIPFDVNL